MNYRTTSIGADAQISIGQSADTSIGLTLLLSVNSIFRCFVGCDHSVFVSIRVKHWNCMMNIILLVEFCKYSFSYFIINSTPSFYLK